MDLDYGGNFFKNIFIAFREQNVFKETDESAPDLPAGSEEAGTEVVIGELRDQLEASKTELEQTKEQILLLRQSKAQLSQEAGRLRAVLEERQDEVEVGEFKQTIIERDQTIESLRRDLREKAGEMAELEGEHTALRKTYKAETDNWLSEKEKVIKYQKQLQLNYVSMYNKNKQLEAEVDQLKASLQKVTAPKAASSNPMSVAKTKYLSKFSSKFSDL